MINFTKKMQAQFDRMCSTNKLFRSSVTGDQIWDLYIKSFKKEHNPVFRDPSSSTYNCNLCRNFLRRYGNIVAVDENFEIITLFDIDVDEEYVKTCDALSSVLKESKVSEVFLETLTELKSLPYEKCSVKNEVFKLGVDKNVKQYTLEESTKYGVVVPNEIRSFTHLHLYLPKAFVDTSGKSVEAIIAEYRDSKNVFERAMLEIPLDTLQLVRDLIVQGSLLDGQTHLHKVEKIIPIKEQYDRLSQEKRSNWCWVTSYKLPIARFRNELIGTLCIDLAEGKELNKACQGWNKKVDPVNYMKTTAPITKSQIDEARKFVENNGYVESFDRRFATIDDIKVSEIKHINVGDGKLKTVSIFDGVKTTSTRHKRSEFDGVKEITIDKFMADILPTCSSVEVFLTNKMNGNMVTMTTSNVKNSKPIFKWNNNYSWTFDGNLAGKSMIKEAVKTAGGKVDGILRFSISWNEDGRSILDFDAHCKTPVTEIYYSNKHDEVTGGWLDVDMIRPGKMGVENITWQNKAQMRDGSYVFFNRNYDGGNNTGFKAEIEIEGEIYSYECLGNIKGDTLIATVTLKNGVFTIEHHQKESHSSKELYGLQTNEFHKVNLVCLSPNHWDINNVGNKHFFFMLDGCICPNKIRSFHNENLIPELAEHRKVLEVLGATNMIESNSKQLSGVGFNATVRDEVIVKLQGSHKRVVKVKF